MPRDAQELGIEADSAIVNGVRIHCERTGEGDAPLVLVHGSWSSHHDWDDVVAGLAESFHAVAYDRRGHSRSERPPGQGSVTEDVADLAALIEGLELTPRGEFLRRIDRAAAGRYAPGALAGRNRPRAAAMRRHRR